MGAYLLLTLALTFPLVTQFSRAIPGDGFDGWQNYWNLWWMKVALVDKHTQPFYTDLLYAPTGVGLFFHTLNPFNGLLALPIQLAWGLLPAYNSVAIFSFVLGGYGAFLLARQVLGPRGSRLAAFAAGVIFTFSPFHFAHLLGHMQVMSLQWIPFYALYLFRLTAARTGVPLALGRDEKQEGQTRKDLLLAAVFLILVGLCDWYYVLYCALLTVVVLAWAGLRVLRNRQPGTRLACLVRTIGPAMAVWLIFSAILSPLLIPMIREARQFSFMVPDPTQSRALSADLLAFFTPQEFHPLWGRWAQTQARAFKSTVSEHQVFAGFVALAAALIGVEASWKKKTWGPWPLALLVFFILALGPVLHIGGRTHLLPGGKELPLPYAWLVQAVPFMEISRSVSRFDVMIMLNLGILAATGIGWLARARPWGGHVGIIILGLILFEYLPAPYPMSEPDTPDWYARLAKDPRPGAVLNLPMNWDRPGYLLYQTVHGKPLTVAYISRNDPRTLTDRVPVLQHFRHLGPDIIAFDLAQQGLQVLNDLGVRWVVLDRFKMPGERERAYNEATTRRIFGDQAPAYQDRRLTVFEVPEGKEVAPYIVLDPGWEAFDATQGSRAFTGQVGVTVKAPTAEHVTLIVTLDPVSERLSLPGDGSQYAIDLSLAPGANQVILRAEQPNARVIVSELRLVPAS